ncbi:MAG: DUF445 domain-containing protein [Neisseria sp.]|uniref:DUF445 domain-containing protein n=1 Tax=Neisseria sp. TaxID=192066 RepID=UPI0026DC1607|nr:DUF445 domain-containing protein [Neisseria sp.]MDO4640203.1 DUF445 domain-containing protein [Neisseria sp.]
MQTLSAQVRAESARERLRRSRILATGLLLAACILFVASVLYMERFPVLAYLKAFSEAAMVGALADWFAVTALFRQPLGLPIPHTAILPRNQHRIAEELGRFIEHNFLQGKPIALRVYQAEPSEKLLNWLNLNRSQWLPQLAAQLPALLKTAKPEQVARFGSQMLAQQYNGDKIGKTLADILAVFKRQGLDDLLLCALIKQIRRWLKHPETRALLEQSLNEWAVKIEHEAPSAWEKIKASLKGSLLERVDGWVSEKALDWADGYLAAALADPQHRLRRSAAAQIDRIGRALAYSRLWHKRLEAGKQELAASPALQEALASLWLGLQQWAQEDVEQADSVVRLQLEKLLDHMLRQAEEYPQFMRRANVRISLMVRDFVQRYKDRAAAFVADKVKSWNSDQMVEKLELSVGRDLQFIRINGTLVGGLVGLLIYCISEWLLK